MNNSTNKITEIFLPNSLPDPGLVEGYKMPKDILKEVSDLVKSKNEQFEDLEKNGFYVIHNQIIKKSTSTVILSVWTNLPTEQVDKKLTEELKQLLNKEIEQLIEKNN